jgi:hypothetical protein
MGLGIDFQEQLRVDYFSPQLEIVTRDVNWLPVFAIRAPHHLILNIDDRKHCRLTEETQEPKQSRQRVTELWPKVYGHPSTKTDVCHRADKRIRTDARGVAA